MKNYYLNSLLCTAFLSITSGALADGLDIKPGLWEIQQKTAMNGQQMPDMQKMMANVPPEMRAQMQTMMAKNGAGMTDKGMTICITPEQISKGDIGSGDPDGHCKMTDMQHAGNKTSMKMHCDGANKADGSTEVTRISDTQWKSTTHMKLAQGDLNTEANGKWLKADCGDIKPLGKK